MGDKPRFGTYSDNDDDQNKSRLHRKVNNSSRLNNRNKNGHIAVLEWIINVFKMQPLSFWLVQYGFGIIGFIIYGWFFINSGIYNLLNLVLYPFTVTILREIGSKVGDSSTFSQMFFASSLSLSVNGLGSRAVIIWILIKLFIFMLRYAFSFLTGLFGLIYIVVQARRFYK